MQLDSASLSQQAVLAQASAAGSTLAGALPPPAAPRPSSTGLAANVGADALSGGRVALSIGAAGLSVLQAPPDTTNRGPDQDRRPPDDREGSAGNIRARTEEAQAASRRLEEEAGPDGLTAEERRVVRELQQRDAEVRRHEQAHQAAGGQYAAGATYQYQRGPDGRLYAVGGEVRIDTGAVPGDPQTTIAKAQTVRRAALAPANPSPQDLRVAAQAQQQINEARADLRAERQEERLDEAKAVEESAASDEAGEPAPATGTEPPPDDNAGRALAADRAFGEAAARSAGLSAANGAPETLFDAAGNALRTAPVDLVA